MIIINIIITSFWETGCYIMAPILAMTRNGPKYLRPNFWCFQSATDDCWYNYNLTRTLSPIAKSTCRRFLSALCFMTCWALVGLCLSWCRNSSRCCNWACKSGGSMWVGLGACTNLIGAIIPKLRPRQSFKPLVESETSQIYFKT